MNCFASTRRTGAQTRLSEAGYYKDPKDMIAELETQPEPEAPSEAGKGKPQKRSKQTQLVFASPSP